MKTTIKDIAQETGLSLATISKYLNNKKIKPGNARLIKDAIERLDYKPNSNAQYLRSGHSATIAIVISELANYFWGSVIGIITEYFMKYNYITITCSYNLDLKQEKNVIQHLIAQNIAGVILFPLDSLDDSYHLLQEAGIPTVVIDHKIGDAQPYPADCVYSDNITGSTLLAEHLLSMGHRDIRILKAVKNSSNVDERIRVFSEVCQKHGTSIPSDDSPMLFRLSDTSIEIGCRSFRETMNVPHPPTAIFFTNYLVAIGALKEAMTCGYAIPDDISLVCFDDDPLFKSIYPPITCVSQNLRKIGRRASKILRRRIEGDYSDFPVTSVAEITFHKRKSVRDLTGGL